jgi:anti-sigma factor RsiW
VTGCPRFGEELSAYRDGELEPGARSAFEAHLGDCPACQTALGSLSWLDEQLAGLPAIQASPQFEARFWARLARAQEPTGWRGALARLARSWRSEWSLPSAAAAALALAALIALQLGRPEPVDADWDLAADAEGFELVLTEDVDLLVTLDVLEEWDGSEEI